MLLLLVSQPLLADVSASLDRKSIYDGDTVTLVIQTDDRDHVGDPDLAGLQQDFEVLGTRTSQQTQIINGRRSDRRTWYIELAPRNSGELTVPAVRVGADETRPLQLSVREQPAAVAAGSGQPLFIKVAVEPADGTARVKQQIQYTLQLYFREDLSEGGFDGPHVDNAVVERLGEDKQYSTTVAGEQYQVIERHYAIFPEQSGKLVISPVVFNGRLAGEPLQRGRSTRMNDMMDRFFGGSMLRAPGKRVRLRSDAVTLDIQPRPASYTGRHWLPSEQLTLRDSWAAGPPEFHAGEPVMRTITLEAKGLESSHLPDISLPESQGMRVYPEQPQQETRTDGESVYGSSAQTVAYVPSATGRITIPAIQLDWWDTREQRQRSAVLPAWEVNVLPGAAGSVEATPPPEPDEGTTGAPETEIVDVTPVDEPQGVTRLQWSLLPAGLFVAMLLVYLLRRKRSHTTPVTADREVSTGKQQLKTATNLLEQACVENNPQAAARALLQWAAARWPEDAPRNLGSLAQRLVTGEQEIRDLEQALYGAGSRNWQGDLLWQVFSKGLQAVTPAAPDGQESLSPLYPDWGAR